jgi:hypothetical protein
MTAALKFLRPERLNTHNVQASIATLDGDPVEFESVNIQCPGLLMRAEAEMLRDWLTDVLGSPWISVDVRLPFEGQDVLYAFNGVTFRGTYLGNHNEDRQPVFAGRSGWLTGDVQFWMPTPAAPESTRLFTE